MSMGADVFLSNYWSQYVLLEREFLQTLQYVNLDEDNAKTFSHAYQKLLLGLGSEVDVTLKYYCRSLKKDFRGKRIDRYCECIAKNRPEFIKQKVKVIHNNQILEPWISWLNCKCPYWWDAYNAVKHNRSEIEEIDGVEHVNYKFANQEYSLNALAGLFQVLVYSYYDIATLEGKEVTTPLPGSRLFILIGDFWDSIRFYGEGAFFTDRQTGHLVYETNLLLY